MGGAWILRIMDGRYPVGSYPVGMARLRRALREQGRDGRAGWGSTIFEARVEPCGGFFLIFCF